MRTCNKNPLKNKALMQRLNPYAKTQAALEAKAIEARKVSRKASIKAKQSKAGRKDKVTRNTRFANLGTEMETAFVAADQVIKDEIEAGLYKAEE